MSVRLYGMTCGWLTMPFHFFLPGAEGWIAIPVPAYLVVHPKGSALFDTGLETALQSKDPHVRDAALGPAAGFGLPTFEPGEDVAGRLRAFGVDPDRIDYLINSHLHIDHCGGNAAIRNARLLVQRREWEAGRTPELIAENLYMPRHYDLGHDRLEVDGEHDLFGDGSVVLVPTYGHTPGHQSLRVKLRTARSSWPPTPAICAKPSRAWRFRTRRSCAAPRPCARIMSSSSESSARAR
jgi:glyoxylase-like metal-dependent hydrolase (beta-lactamase superfamily II)